MSTPQFAAIYARISSDQEGTGKGVERQLEDCRKLTAERGWSVAGEYVDNDVSAYSGKRRPAYERMLSDIVAGERDAVVVYHLDRLHRQPLELETFTRTCDASGLSHVATVTGDLDLGSDDGLFTARVLAAVAAKESARKSARMRRAYQQKAESGMPQVSRRPYGFELDGITHRPDEVAVIRESIARLLAGESLRSICINLNDDGMLTSTGREWQTQTMKRIVTNPRVAGLREYRGEVVGPGVWEPIVDETKRQRVLAAFEAKKMSARRSARTYLLSGMLRCGRCGNKLFSNIRKDSNTRRYVCLSGPDHGGCGRMSVVAEPVEQLLAAAVLFRLDSPQVADELAGRAARDERASGLQAALEVDQALLEELAREYSQGLLKMPIWRVAREPIEARIRTAQRQLAEATGTLAASAWIGQGAALRESWAQMNLDRQVAIVRSILDHAVVSPAKKGSSGFDPNRVDPRWLL